MHQVHLNNCKKPVVSLVCDGLKGGKGKEKYKILGNGSGPRLLSFTVWLVPLRSSRTGAGLPRGRDGLSAISSFQPEFL